MDLDHHQHSSKRQNIQKVDDIISIIQLNKCLKSTEKCCEIPEKQEEQVLKKGEFDKFPYEVLDNIFKF